MYRQFNIQQFYVLPTQCIYVFCVDLRTNSDYFPTQQFAASLLTVCVFWYQERTKFLYISTFKLLHDAGSQSNKRSTVLRYKRAVLKVWSATTFLSPYDASREKKNEQSIFNTLHLFTWSDAVTECTVCSV